MTRRLNRICSLKGILLKQIRKVHKVTLHKLGPVGNGGVTRTNLVATIHLVGVQRDADNLFTIQEAANVAHGTANTTSDVQDLAMVTGDIEFGRQLVFMPSSGLPERFKGEFVVKVKAWTPPPLVKDGGQVVVGVDESLVIRVAVLHLRRVQVKVTLGALIDSSRTCEALFLFF